MSQTPIVRLMASLLVGGLSVCDRRLAFELSPFLSVQYFTYEQVIPGET